MDNHRIFLIGFMGAGKTTLGKKLAKKLNLPFIDVDSKIEEKYNMTISSIFEQFNEKIFRTIERKIMLQLIEENKEGVFSVGGGLPCFNENMTLLNENGTTFYLQHPPKELHHRVINSKKKRPLLQGKSTDELLEYIEKMLAYREVFYNQAHHIIGRENQLDQIIEILRPERRNN